MLVFWQKCTSTTYKYTALEIEWEKAMYKSLAAKSKS